MRGLFKYLKPYKFFAILSPLLMMGEVLADLCLPYLMSFIVNYGIIGEDIRESGVAFFVMRTLFGDGAYSSLQIIFTFGILMLLIVLIGGFFGTFCAYTAARAAQGFGHDLRRDAYKKVMSHLAVNGSMGQLEIVELTHLKPPPVSTLLRRMEQEGYITRVTDEKDRRAMRVTLSEKGLAFDRDQLRRLSTNDHQAVKGLSADEQKTLEALLLRMRDNLTEV